MSKWPISLVGANAERSRAARSSSHAANSSTTEITKPKTPGHLGENRNDTCRSVAAQRADGAGRSIPIEARRDGEAHLRRLLQSYARYYNAIRTHRSLDK